MRVSISKVNDVEVRAGGVVEGQVGAGGAEGQVARGQFRGRLLMFFARSFKVLGIRFWQTFNSQSTLMVVLYPKISFFHMGICREWCHI